MNEYNLKFVNAGVWMETAKFIELVTELQERFGLDAKVTPATNGLTFTIEEKNDA